jgi:N-methylhydantoinase B
VTAGADGDVHTFDGIQLAVLTNRFEGAVRAMMNTLVRTGRSGVLNTGHDFSCCVLSADGEMLAMAESLPIHVMSGPDLTAKVMTELHPTLRRGDAFFHNSPYHGNSHAADHSMLVPVIDSNGRHRFTVFAKAHQADCGNAVPTTYHAAARDVYEEGALLFPCVKVQQNYEDCEDIIRMCRLRIRVPDQWWGDYLALLGAVRIGERRMLELGDEFGWDTLDAYTEQWFDYSEQRMIEAIRALPSGRVTMDGTHDPFPNVEDGIPVKATVEVNSEDALIEVDLRDNPDCQPCGLNLTESCSRTAAMIGVFNSLEHDVPTNAGSFRRLRLHLRENCCVGIPRHPASCSVATTDLADRVANAVQHAMAELGDGIGMAEVATGQPAGWGVISGRDPRADDAPFVNQIFLPAGTLGGGGTRSSDGWLTACNIGSAGMLWRDSIEVREIHHPVRIHTQRIIPDSEGAGRFRGAPGGYTEYGPVDCSLEVFYTSDGTVHPAQGARGGSSGAHAQQYRRDVSGELHELGNCGPAVLAPGETIVAMCCGGGGYGPPHERGEERVLRDVVEGWISPERAREVYGVVVDADGAVDGPATAERRAALADGHAAEVARPEDEAISAG